MSFQTSNMGLIVWDLGPDFYDHSQLANDLAAIDTHDHGPDHGVQIPTEGLTDLAVTTAKIANSAVTTPKIADLSVTGVKIAPNSINSGHVIDGTLVGTDIAHRTVTGLNLATNVVPLGEIIMWWRPDSSYTVPAGWEICDGRAWNLVSNDWGLSSGNLPDLRNKFVLGAATSGTVTGPTTPPAEGYSGGAMIVNLAHAHYISDHHHNVNGHSHTVSAHNHSIPFDGSHHHTYFNGTTFVTLQTRGAATSTGSTFQAAYVPGLNTGNNSSVDATMSDEANHNHGGATGGGGGGSTGSSTTDTDFTATPMDSQLGNTDLRPNYIGLLFLIKVKDF